MNTSSNSSQVPARSILVAGDVCLDVVAVPITAKTAKTEAENWRLTGETRTHFLPGGAMLLAELVRAAEWAAAQTRAEEAARATAKTAKLDEVTTSRQIEDARRAVKQTTEDEVLGPRPKMPAGINEVPQPGESASQHFFRIAERLRRDEIVHSLLALAEFPTTADKNDKTKTLRVEREHGYSGPTDDKNAPQIEIGYPPSEQPQVIVLDDTGNSFRRGVTSNPWPGAVRTASATGAKPLIIYKLHRPLPPAPNLLWQAVAANHPANRLVILTVEDLRERGLPINRGLSWERTTLDVVWHLINTPDLAGLHDCPRLIIRLGESGAIYWQQIPPTNGAVSSRAWLIYDPGQIEGSFTAQFDHRGRMVASGSAFTAALVQHLAAASDKDFNACLAAPAAEDVEKDEPLGAVLSGIRAGLLASRRLLQLGFGTKPDEPRYPGPELFAPPGKKEDGFACRKIPIISGALQPDRSYWRLLDDIFTDAAIELRRAVELTATGSKPEKPLRADASSGQIQAADDVTKAAALLSQAPIAVFAGALRTYDRREIENYRALYSLLHDYIRLREPERPLSVAVFGPPGAGKSFGVKQVAKALTEHNQKRPLVDLTFNLSQYQTADELAAAFHLVRDLVLQGKIPLVFFDEFDTALDKQKLAWLRYFLAPMQDGLFLDRGTLHPIGQAIFVFAGGTCDTYQEFATHPMLTDAEFKAAKGPDFLSRLRGALDIPSLNFVLPQGSHAPRRPGTFDPYGPMENFPCEPAILLRRAGVLAYQLGIKGPALKDAKGAVRVSPEVLRAFLHLPQFVHGNRSLEALLDMSHLHEARTYTASLLPPAVNTLLHANPEHFGQLVGTGYPFPDEDREKIARSIHAAYLAGKPVNADPSALLAWDDPNFPDHFKQSNFGQADHIATKLRFVGLWFRKTPPGSPRPALANMEKHIEDCLIPLAQFEHDRWAAQRRQQGWSAGPDTSDASKIPALKLHNCLFPWDKLTADQQKLDHDAIRAIPRHLAAAGYEIVKL